MGYMGIMINFRVFGSNLIFCYINVCVCSNLNFYRMWKSLLFFRLWRVYYRSIKNVFIFWYIGMLL